MDKLYLSVGILFGLILSVIIGFKFNQNNIVKKENEVEWGSNISFAILTNFKEKSTNISIGSYIVKSPIDKNLRTSFYLADGTWLRSLDGAGGVWGRGGTPLGGNPFKQPLPEVLHVTYFDRYDNQFYQLIQPLPKAKVLQLFTTRQKSISDKEETPPIMYRTFDIGFAPKGWIILFAVGPGLRQEIGSWQADKIEADYATTIGLTRTSDMEYLRKNDIRTRDVKSALKGFQDLNPELYKLWLEGKWKVSSDWYKKLQTKYPWNLEVTAKNGEWSGEYYAEYANTERFEVVDKQLIEVRNKLKPIPIKIITWLTYKPTGVRYYIEVHLFNIPKWSADDYIPYYQDPNLNYYFQRFQYLYPSRSLETNQNPALESEFSTLKMEFDDDFKLKDVYLKKGNEKLPLEGAYEFYLAPVEVHQGGFSREDGHDYFLTESKSKDLTDPLFADRD